MTAAVFSSKENILVEIILAPGTQFMHDVGGIFSLLLLLN